MRLLPMLLLIVAISGTVDLQAQQPDNKKPMYGEVPKTDEYKKFDEEFITSAVALTGSKEKGCETYLKKAWAYFYHDSLDLAMKRFNQSWLLNPENPDTYFGFAALMEIQGNKSEAERFYKIGISKDTENKRTEVCYQKIADCKEQIQDFKGTIDAYEKIVSIDSINIFAYKKLGYFYDQEKNNEKAIGNYNKAIELDAKDPMTYNNRGYLNQASKNYPLALSDYSMAIQLDPKYISIR